jgi:hypothetical protein
MQKPEVIPEQKLLGLKIQIHAVEFGLKCYTTASNPTN